MYIERLHGEKLLLILLTQGWVYRIYSIEKTKRKENSMYKGKQRREPVSLQTVLFLFIFDAGCGLIRLYMICVFYTDKSCYIMYDFNLTIKLLVQFCYIPVFLINFNLFTEGLLPPDMSDGHRNLALKIFFTYIYMLVHHGLLYNRALFFERLLTLTRR